ncbi:RTC4-like domain-containing protein [Elsinoe australis]|uniref:Restriction of telomere capping protein 4 n=1 Tax=Elsinoe australis TaxID=40998 RepID=A0A4U7B6U9_9PEZI|nr:RTC4-like domain-containing protein [Elsinoe australis]
MPLLQRSTARLLRQVGKRPHATKQDHEELLSSPSSLSEAPSDVDEEKLMRSPESSGDERGSSKDSEGDKTSTKGNLKASNTRAPRAIHNDQKSASSTKENGFYKAGSKRKSPEPDEPVQPDWLSSSQTRRPKTFSKYGSQSQRSQNSFKKPSSTPPKPKPKATFKRPNGLNASPKSSPPESRGSGQGFRRPTAATDIPAPTADLDNISHPTLSSPLGSPISSPPPPEVEEVYLDGNSPADFAPCPICSEAVSKAFRMDWELEHCAGRRMNLKMQEKFCQAHKENKAAAAWQDAEYPEVDWGGLKKRLGRHKRRIEEILEGEKGSVFRQELEDRVKMKESRTAVKSMEAGGVRGMVGYYGSRGAKVMTDYALKAFAAKLRALAGQDQLMVASGVAGGVSGYVQAVIVPELAMSLIMEDMDVDEQRAKVVLEESSELGNLLNIEEEEKLPTRPATPPPTYGADGSTDTSAFAKYM